MIVIPPVIITDAMLVSSTVAEPDATALGDGVSTTVWAAGTTYAAGARVTRPTTHRIYQSPAGGNVGNIPEDTLATTPAKWVNMGPTNKSRMLRVDANYQTNAPSPLTVVINPVVRITAVSISGLEAESVYVELRDSANAVAYSKTSNLNTRDVGDWYDYFFADFTTQSAVLLLDVPPISGSKLTVTVSSPTGRVQCGPIVAGTPVDLGSTASGATAGSIDTSRVLRDLYGNSDVLKKKNYPRTSQSSLIENPASLDKVRETLNNLYATAATYIGVEDATSGLYNSLAVLGLLKEWQFNFDDYPRTTLTTSIEGL